MHAIDRYVNLDLRLAGADRVDAALRFTVQVIASPAGEQLTATPVELAVRPEQLVALEARELNEAQQLELGWQFGDALLPSVARYYYHNSLSTLKPREGLRIRLSCEATELDRLPWELACVEPGGGVQREGLGTRAYLVLRTRVSLVRRVIGPDPNQGTSRRPGPRRRLIAMACEPADLRDPRRPLDLVGEMSRLKDALGDAAIDMVECTPPTQSHFVQLLDDGVDVFHFAGHGGIDKAGRAGLNVEDDQGMSRHFPADALALRLSERGLQLAVLGACQSGKVDGHSIWSGIAPSLVRAGVPAVIGMQYSVQDRSAKAFSVRFYDRWLAYPTLDEAVQQARLAILDEWTSGGRDFMTPVLYVRDVNVVVPPAAVRMAPFVKLLGDVGAYKEVHEALHESAMQELPLLAAMLTTRSIARRTAQVHVTGLKKKLFRMRSVAASDHSNGKLLEEIVAEFESALASLDTALDDATAESLDAALFMFESLLGWAPDRIDSSMCQLALDRTAEFVASLPIATGSADGVLGEIRHLKDQLSHAAEGHNLCQRLSVQMTLFLKTRAGRTFASMSLTWKHILVRLGQATQGWHQDLLLPLMDEQKAFQEAVDEGRELDAQAAFDALYQHFSYGFFTVDADFKRLCRVLLDRARERGEAVSA